MSIPSFIVKNYGAIQYSIITKFEDFYICHCVQYQKNTGSAFTSNFLKN